MAWMYLILAGLFEMVGVSLINKFNNEKSWQSVLYLLIGFGASFYFLNLAMNEITMGTAYAIWTGIGAAGGAVMGMLFYGEAKDWRRIICLFLIIGSAIGLKLVS
ncbi:DMT family transporter [Vagococcus xieshaowenii]|uniref:Multidrug efflux SMR transporter n=1 Tax=Vagococcus xieshaowenii TaxID=2562451 RepID=A0AAJ5EFE8_9ENTE|nr:multidrug efflux SMR transporter [Vagococcus xieshaowenii]QCA28420.1 multidrug efflux SMR transporter [Vagococcus xieshaowenii]TFZ42824.1 multidrug efflux SMR transporter [Vagococcus xieshaowenii]